MAEEVAGAGVLDAGLGQGATYPVSNVGGAVALAVAGEE